MISLKTYTAIEFELFAKLTVLIALRPHNLRIYVTPDYTRPP